MDLLREAGLPDGVINFLPGNGRDHRRRRAAAHAISPACTSPAPPRSSSGMWQDGRRRTSARYRTYPAPRRRDRRQGLRLRAPLGRRRRAGGRAGARRLRVPGAEVLGRQPRLHARRRCGPACASGWSTRSAQVTVGDVRPTSATSWARSSTRPLRDAASATSTRRAPPTTARSWPAASATAATAGSSSRRWSRPPSRNAASMCEEIFGPVLTVYVYEDERLDEALALCDATSPYALTGAVFARDRGAIGAMTARAAPRGRQLLHQRQAHRRRGRPAALRRRARLGHQRQGRLAAQPAALGLAAHDQGDLRAAHRLALPAHERALNSHTSSAPESPR